MLELQFVTFVLVFFIFVVCGASLLVLYTENNRMAASLSDLVTDVADVSASVDALIARIPAPTPPVDLQPAVDALAVLKAKIDAIVAV